LFPDHPFSGYTPLYQLVGQEVAAVSDDSPSRTAKQLQVDSLHWGTLRDWAQLVRLPNVFTLLSDTIAAAIVAAGMLLPLTAFIPTLLASILAYWAGMILNDVADLEEDRRDRPHRPLASDAISPVVAGHIGTGMLLVSPILILAVCTYHHVSALWLGAAFLAAAGLSLAVRGYNSPLKHSPLGPLLMGGCRAINILMVGSVMFAVTHGEVFPRAVLYYATGIGLYILGVTIYAHREEKSSSPTLLIIGMLFELAGLICLAAMPYWTQLEGTVLEPLRGYPLLIGLIGLTVINRGVSGVLHPVPRKVQLAVKHAILTLILLDAAVVVMWGGVWYGAAVALLLLPAFVVSARFRTT
jgi:4-hydroxybenzoate polyprenyltransferase